MTKYKIAIIGGGAAGFFSAVSAARHSPESEVTIYEATNKLLAKVLISGGGRCNVTNNTPEVSELIKNYPRGHKELRGPFSVFAVRDTIAWFAEHGVQLKAEPDGRMFPITDSSETIAACLIQAAKNSGVKILMKHKVSKILKSTQAAENADRGNDCRAYQIFCGRASDELQCAEYDKIILTTGGSKSSLNLARSLGQTITDLVPSLFSFEINDSRFENLSGISFQNVALELLCSKKKFKHEGPILITHWGLSGPATIKLSAIAAKELFTEKYKAQLKINFFPNENQESMLVILNQQRRDRIRAVASIDSFLDIPKRYWATIVDRVAGKERQIWNEFSKKQLMALAAELTGASFEVDGKGVFKDEFVTCGGVSLKEINFKTMESKISPGLHFAGEVLDIDGITGGFNFQAAWTCGWIAGMSSASKIC